MYDMPLRDYDPAIGRWVVLDPVIHHSQSPYSGFNGNPVVFADPSGGAGQQMLDNNGAEMYDSNGNFIRRSDRVVPRETSKFTQAGVGGSTVQKMVNAINSLSDEQRALLPPPDVILQLLLAEENACGDWEGMFRGMDENAEKAVKQKGHLKEWLKNAGIDFRSIPSMTTDQVFELINKVPELAKFYSESGNFDISINKTVSFDLTSGNTISRCGTMTFGTDAFKSMLSLGISIFYETGHALDLYSGAYAKFNSISDSDGFRTEVMEYRMYERELQYALHEYYRLGLYYRNLFYMRIANRGVDPDSFLKW